MRLRYLFGADKPEDIRRAGERLSVKDWRAVLACGDHLDRFPCASCAASGSSGCGLKMPLAKQCAARDFINAYGWAAARRLGRLPA